MKSADLKLTVGVRGRELSRLPRFLCHRQNAEYLAGISALYGARGIGEALEHALRYYAKEADLLSVANWDHDWITAPSLKVLLNQRDDLRGFNVHQKLADTEAYGAWPQGPKLIVIVSRRGVPKLDIVTVSLASVLANAIPAFGKYMVYAHTFVPGNEFRGVNSRTGLTYVGLTRQGWTARLAQHRSSARTGSPYLFHRAIRAHDETAAHVHQVLASALDYPSAMAHEERWVENFSLYPLGLNMIPGGFAGMRWLAERGAEVTRRGWENRETVLARFGKADLGDGRPKPLIAALWGDDAYAASVICGNPRNFRLQEVAEIRQLSALGRSTESIAEQFGASTDRVKRLLAGKTYARIHHQNGKHGNDP